MGRQAQGNGTLRKRSDGRWEGRYSLGRDPATGKQIQKSVYGKTQNDVRKKLQSICASIDEGFYSEPSKMNIKQWFDIWIEEYTSHLKPLTLRAYKVQINKHIIPSLGFEKLSTLQVHQIQAFYNNLTKIGLAPATVRLTHAIIHSALKQAVELDYIKVNPTDRCKLPKKEQSKMVPLMGNDVKLFLEAIKGHPFETLYIVDLFTGMRKSEIVGLTWDCVNFEKGTITLQHQLQQINSSYVLTPLKNSKIRVITPPITVMELLREQRVAQNINQLRVGAVWDNKFNLVFTNEIGGNLVHGTVCSHYKKIVASIGLPEVRFHDLRHSYAVIALQSGDNVKVVQEALGHYSAAFTLDVYGHVSDEMRKESAMKIESFIKNISG